MNLEKPVFEERVLRWFRENFNPTEMVITLMVGLAITIPIWGPYLVWRNVADRMRYYRSKRYK